MSMHRINPAAGRVDPATLPRGSEGRCLCRHCGREVPRGRRTFCGDVCVETWRLRSDPTYVRSRVWKRDKGRCAQCGLRCREVEKSLALLRQVLSRLGQSKAYGALRKALKVTSRHSLWDADHIRAVVEGGGECGLDNMQTLCLWCHKDKTADLRSRVDVARA
ncbi:MAG TPA: HNH endonuclease [Planctomycetota bacterium]|nr:HNH endonuclease [Planctomycetota bacterium]